MNAIPSNCQKEILQDWPKLKDKVRMRAFDVKYIRNVIRMQLDYLSESNLFWDLFIITQEVQKPESTLQKIVQQCAR